MSKTIYYKVQLTKHLYITGYVTVDVRNVVLLLTLRLKLCLDMLELIEMENYENNNLTSSINTQYCQLAQEIIFPNLEIFARGNSRSISAEYNTASTSYTFVYILVH